MFSAKRSRYSTTPIDIYQHVFLSRALLNTRTLCFSRLRLSDAINQHNYNYRMLVNLAKRWFSTVKVPIEAIKRLRE